MDINFDDVLHELIELESGKKNLFYDYDRLVRKVKKSSMDESDKKKLFEKISLGYPASEVTQNMVSLIDQDIGLSYQSSIISLMHFKKSLKRFGVSVAPGGNPKLKDREFAKILGIPVPETLFVGSDIHNKKIPDCTIVKPVNGSSSHGVFFKDYDGSYSSIRTGRQYRNIVNALTEIPHKKNLVSIDKWVVEEAIVGDNGFPANDIKVYIFYGQVGFVLEIRRINGSKSYCRYDRSGEVISVGHVNAKIDNFIGDGFGEKLIEYSSRISKESPVPFLRIDFHKGKDEYVLGEITPHPGWHAGERSADWDQRLGRLFNDAWAELYYDILKGKSFSKYFSVYNAL